MNAQQEEVLASILGQVGEETRQRLQEVPRQQRVRLLAGALHESEMDTLAMLADNLGLPMVSSIEGEPEGSSALPIRLIHDYQCMPLPDDGESENDPLAIDLITVWPPDRNMDKWVLAASGRQPRWHLGPPELISETITEVYGVGADSLEDSDLGEFSDEDDGELGENENAAIVRFINEIVMRAIEERATDIHFEPQKDILMIRYRIDGQLDPVRVPENLVQYQGAIINRLKIMARLNITEKRRPQDGRITFEPSADFKASGPLDIRISTLPTMYGESVSLRLLNQRNQPLSIAELGLLPDDEETLMKYAASPYGIILVTGPTGSGKSTTLTAVIRRIQDPERRIITVEDPVEYEVPGINQTQVQPEVGLDFAAALRTVLRQDPDVIMVGEIRDRETADIGVRASLTGHLVLSTLHTNDAAGALTRLIDMGIEPFLIASSVQLIIAQRLVRRLNPALARKAEIEMTRLQSCLTALGVPMSEMMNAHQLKEPGSHGSGRAGGFHGRLGIFEMLQVSEHIHEMIVEKASARAMRRHAIEEDGMRTLQQCGWEQVKAGMTTLGELMRLSTAIEGESD